MPGITVTATDLSVLTGSDVDADRFASVDRAARSLIASVYRGDLDAAQGRSLDVLNAVYSSVAVRLLTNPSGARSVALDGASVTYGGSDEAVSAAFALTASERASLRDLSARRRPSFIPLVDSPYRWST